MSIVTLVSGGLDSTLMAALTKEAGTEQHPLFVDYGQRAKKREFAACVAAMQSLGLAKPEVAGLSGFGALIHTGLTDPALHVSEEAFTPGRNMMFLLVGAAYAYTKGADSVAIGLLHDDTAIFPDQTSSFLRSAESLLTTIMGVRMAVLAPLKDFFKQDVVAVASQKGIAGTYSCHVGGEKPCGECIACQEFNFLGAKNGW